MKTVANYHQGKTFHITKDGKRTLCGCRILKGPLSKWGAVKEVETAPTRALCKRCEGNYRKRRG